MASLGRKVAVLLGLVALAMVLGIQFQMSSTTATSNECEDYARELGIDEQVVSILSWLCLDGVMDEREQEFIELLAKLAPELQWDLANRLAIDGQISESDLAEVRAIFNTPINDFETPEEIEAWGTGGGAILEQSELYATEGRYSGKVSFFSGEERWAALWLDLETLKVTDWSSYYAVGLDVYNPQEESFFLEYHIGDEDGSNFWPDFFLVPGMNRLRIYIDDLRNDRPYQEVDEELIEEEPSAFDAHQIKKLTFYIEPPVPEVYEGPQPNGPILYFDNLRLIPREEAPETENLLKNGGFENFESDWSFSPREEVTWEFDCQDPFEGDVSLKVTLMEGTEARATSSTMAIQPGKEYTFSVWLKADRPHLKIMLVLDAYGFSDPHWSKHKLFYASTSWERYEFIYVMPKAVLLDNKLSVRLDLREKGTLWADGADFRITHVREAVAADYTKPANVLFHLPFDGTAEAQVAQGDKIPIKQERLSYVKGIKGQAVMVDGYEDILSYSTQGNLDKEMGSIEMWVKLNWDPVEETKKRVRHDFFNDGIPYSPPGSGNLHIHKCDYWPTLNFGVTDANERQFQDDISWWRKDEWHHIVATWDHRVGTRLYIDGVFRFYHCEVRFNDFTWHVGRYESMFVGGQEWYQADAAIDELRIYDRPLNQEEVRDRYIKFIPVDFHVEHSVFKVGEPAEVALVLTNNRDEQITGALSYELIAPSSNVAAQGEKEGISIEAESKTTLQIAFQPEEEGEYLLNLFWDGHTSYKRSLALFVMGRRGDDPPGQAGLKLKLVEEIDPVSVTSPDRYVDDGTARIVHSPIGTYREAGEEKFSSFAYRFRIEHPQVPHLIVVEYPDDRARIFDIVLDGPYRWNRCLGACWDVQTGVFTGDEYPLTNTLQEHRIIFWPRELDNALVFLSWAEGEPAAVSKISIYEIEGGLPELEVNPPGEPQRLLGLFWEDPALPLEFGNLDTSFSQLYQTFTRLMEYLKYTGQNLIVYPVFFYSSPLYPSQVEPEYVGHSRRLYHPGDWVELLLKVAEQYGVKVLLSWDLRELPSLHAAANTDEESVRAGEDTINLISCDGRISKNLQARSDPHPDYIPGPIFDPIHPKVQERILALVDEILERYGDLPAFGGLQFLLRHDTFLWFGSLNLGYGDYDVNLFEEETGINVPGDPPDSDRFQKRCAFLTQGDPTIRERWINWRCQKIDDLWMKIHRRVQDKRDDLSLVLYFWLPYTHYNPSYKPALELGPEEKWSLLAREEDEPLDQFVREMYREGGLDLDFYKGIEGLYIEKFSRPSNYRWMKAYSHWWIETYHEYSPQMILSREIDFDPDYLSLFANGERTAVAIFNRYFETAVGREQPLPGYWWEPVAWRASAITPAHKYFMEYYAHALATYDATQIGNGGLTIGTMGHEEQIRKFAEAYRALPAKHFSIYEREVTEPIQIRELWEPEKDRYWFYLINREYYSVQVDLTFDSLSTLTDLATREEIRMEDGRLSLEIGPYELVSFLATPAAAKIISVQVTLLDLMGKE